MGTDDPWIYWLAGLSAAVLIVYLIVVLFNADRLD